MEIIANVHLISNVTANLYLIVDSNGLALIDAGLPGSDNKKILKYITGYGSVVMDAANKFPKI
jgi:glyoxylase-like metal-dependent hydrolase (beta-lactamase superfamily II)